MTRYFFATGYRSQDEAIESMNDSFADSEIDASQSPQVERYEARASRPNKRVFRWGVTLTG